MTRKDLADGVQISVGPYLVEVRSELPGVAEHLTQLYPGFSIGPPSGGHFALTINGAGGVRRWWRSQARLVINGATPFLPVPASVAGGALEWGLNFCIGNVADRFVAVHAAVVERSGKALILCAPSGSGKSTLCAALVLAGWRLFSDEFALIDVRTGDIVAAPRPLSLKEKAIDVIRRRGPDAVFSRGGVDVEGQRFVHMRPPPDSVRRSHESVRRATVVLPKYLAGAPTSIIPMSKARALIGLTAQSFNYTLFREAGYRCLSHLVDSSDAYQLEYSELDDVLPRLAQIAS